MSVQRALLRSTGKNLDHFAQDKITGALLIVPALFIVFVVMLVPLAYGLMLSVTDFRLGDAGFGNLVYLDNYVKALKDGIFLHSLKTTLIFTGVVLAAELTLGILIAVLLMKIPTALGKFLRTVYTIPLLISPIIVGLTWRYMYDPLYGLVYQTLDALHLDHYFGGLGSVHWALFCVMIADIWQTTPFILLVVTASLATIPLYLYEAARIDGAGEFRIFFIITLPMLRNALIVLTVIRGVDAFRVFDIIYALTNGGQPTPRNR